MFPSCKKAPLSIGKIVTESRALNDFNEVHLNNDISLTLVRSDTCYISITTGENIIDNITTNINGGILNISNISTINWLRTYDYELHATLYYKDIKRFVFSSCGSLKTENQYNCDSTDIDYYTFEVDDGSGDIDLLFNNCKRLYITYHRGTSCLNIHGNDNNYVNIYKKSYGLLNAKNLDSDTVIITNRSSNDCYVKANKFLKANIQNLGDIYYRGDPDSISVVYGPEAEGKLIKIQ